MRDAAKTKQQLIAELDELRSRVARQERERAELSQVLETLGRTEGMPPAGEARYQTLFNTMVQGVVYQAPDGRIIDANPAAERLLGLTLAELQGRTSMDVRWRAIREDGSAFPGEEHPSMVALRTGCEVRDVVMGIHHPRSGACRWMNIQAVPEFRPGESMPYRVYTTFEDITDRREAERRLLKSESRFKLLSKTAAQLLRVDDPLEIVKELACEVMAELDCQAFFNFVVEERVGKLRLNAFAGISAEEARSIAWLDYGAAICGCVARDAVPVIAEDVDSSQEMGTDLVRSHGLKAYACHPLMAGARLIGTLSFGTKTRARFSPRDLDLMKTVADQVAIAIERTQLLDETRVSTSKLEAALASMVDAVFVSDLDGNFVDFNEAFATFHRFKSKEECLKSLAAYPDILDVFLDNGELAPLDMWAVPRALRGERATNVEYTMRRKDTGETWVGSYSFAPVRDRGGAIVGSVVVGRDVTDQKRTEAAFKLSEERARERAEELEKLMDLAPIAIFLAHDPLCHTITGNRAANRLYEAGEGENLTASPPSDQPPQQRRYFRSGRQLASWELPMQYAVSHNADLLGQELDVLLASGRRMTLLGSASPLRESTGRVRGCIAGFMDITDRKLAEDALRRQQGLLESVMRTTDVMLVLLDPRFNFVWVNPAYARTCGMTPEEMVGKSHFALYPDAENEATFRRVLETGDSVFHKDKPFQFPERPDRGVTYWDWSLMPVKDADEKVTGLVFSLRETTEYKRAEAALRTSEERFRELAENIHEVFWVRTPDEILYISPAYEAIYGRSCMSLRADPNSFLELVHPDDRERVVQAFHTDMEGTAPFAEEFRIVREDGAVRWIWARSFPVFENNILMRTAGVAEDITARKEAEEFLRIERDLALQLGSAATLDDALSSLLRACLGIADLDCGGIYLVERETEELRLVCHQGVSEAFLERVSLFPLSSSQGRFAMQGEPGYWSEPVQIFEMASLFQTEGLRALASIPVRSEGTVVALLNVCSHTHAEISSAIRASLESIASHIGEIIARVRLGETIKAQSERLEDSNAALRVLLRQREHDRADLEESFVSNVKHLILPYLDKLKSSRLNEDQRRLFAILESHLGEITSPFVRKISSSLIGLTPTEIRVAELIRQGKSTKEIAELLLTSETTVIFHRQGVRRKLGLIGKPVNLQTYLSSLL